MAFGKAARLRRPVIHLRVNIHSIIGKVSFDEAKLAENLDSFVTTILKLKPATVTVHYYVEGTETKLCEDVSLNKKYKDNYSATPCTNLNDNDYKYKEVVTNDSNSNINGSKVTGTVNQDEVIINYFYELKPANVVVHHYIEGTTTKLCEDIDTMYKGIEIEEGKMAYAEVSVLEIDNSHTTMEILLYQGMNRQIRKMFEHLGFEVVSLKRIQHATLNLDGLKRGEFKPVKPTQIKELKNFLNRIAK